MNKELLNTYVNDKSLFRKHIRNCKTNEELYKFLLQIQSIKGYKLYVPNRWCIPVEDITIYKDSSIYCYFYMAGSRSYKSIQSLGRVVELIECSNYDTFTLTYYDRTN